MLSQLYLALSKCNEIVKWQLTFLTEDNLTVKKDMIDTCEFDKI